jgi:hypothetical protein
MRRIDESISVLVNQNTEPIGFSWRGQSYVVRQRPTRWFARKEWWVESARVQRGIGAGTLEVEMWRVLALPVSALNQAGAEESNLQTMTQFQLIHNSEQHTWRLERVFD